MAASFPRALVATFSACIVAACDASAGRTSAGRSTAARDSAMADTLSRLIADAYDFSRPDVVPRLMALYAPDGPIVSAAAGRLTTSRAALQQSIERFWQRVGQNMQQPHFVIGEKRATVLGPDAAVLTFVYAIPHRTPEGQPHTLGGAWTAVFERRAGRWVIVQEHLSDPPIQPRQDSMPGMQMP